MRRSLWKSLCVSRTAGNGAADITAPRFTALPQPRSTEFVPTRRCENELRALCAALAQDSRASQSALEQIQEHLNLVHAVLDDATASPAGPDGQGGGLGYVYAITDGSAVKIGWTARHPGMPGGRLSQLQTAHFAELTLIGAMQAPVHWESELHRRFSEHRIRGEWFRYVPAIVEYFDQR